MKSATFLRTYGSVVSVCSANEDLKWPFLRPLRKDLKLPYPPGPRWG